MPRLIAQSQFRRWPKPAFCYLCGESLANGSPVNDDHCPPKGMFAAVDRQDYPLVLQVHEKCNHAWHIADETMALFLDVLHGGKRVAEPRQLAKLSFLDIQNEQGRYQAINNFPIKPLAHRILRCMHALLYGEHLPAATPNTIHIPIPEVDESNGNRPMPHLPQTYQFANELCTAQKTNTFDAVSAYNGKFRYVSTWHKADNGQPLCLFAFDIYRLSNFGVRIQGFPQAVIGSYLWQTPAGATRCSELRVDHPDHEILYPLL